MVKPIGVASSRWIINSNLIGCRTEMVLRAFHPQTLRLLHKISVFGAFSALEKSAKVDGGQGGDEAIARKGSQDPRLPPRMLATADGLSVIATASNPF
jgi:hypothetical protein